MHRTVLAPPPCRGGGTENLGGPAGANRASPSPQPMERLEKLLEGASLPSTPASIAALRLVHDCVSPFNLGTCPGRNAAIVSLADRVAQLQKLQISMPLFAMLASDVAHAIKAVDAGVPQAENQVLPSAMPHLTGLGIELPAKRQRLEAQINCSLAGSLASSSFQGAVQSSECTTGSVSVMPAMGTGYADTTSSSTAFNNCTPCHVVNPAGPQAAAMHLLPHGLQCNRPPQPMSPTSPLVPFTQGEQLRSMPAAPTTSCGIMRLPRPATPLQPQPSCTLPLQPAQAQPAAELACAHSLSAAAAAALATAEPLSNRIPRGTVPADHHPVRVDPAGPMCLEEGCLTALLGGVPTSNTPITFQLVLNGSLLRGLHTGIVNTTASGRGFISCVPEGVRAVVAGAFFVGVVLSNIQVQGQVGLSQGANGWAAKLAGSLSVLVFEHDEAFLPQRQASHEAKLLPPATAAWCTMPSAAMQQRPCGYDADAVAAAAAAAAAAAPVVVAKPRATCSSTSMQQATSAAPCVSSAAGHPAPAPTAAPSPVGPGSTGSLLDGHSPGCSVTGSVDHTTTWRSGAATSVPYGHGTSSHSGPLASPQQQQMWAPSPLSHLSSLPICAPSTISRTSSTCGPTAQSGHPAPSLPPLCGPSPCSASTPMSCPLPPLSAALQAPDLSCPAELGYLPAAGPEPAQQQVALSDPVVGQSGQLQVPGGAPDGQDINLDWLLADGDDDDLPGEQGGRDVLADVIGCDLDDLIHDAL